MKTVVLRKSCEADLSLTFEIKKAALKDYIVATFGPWNEAWQLDEHRKDFSSGQFDVIVADGIDVGYVWIKRTDSSLYLVDVCVLPKHQGSGIGTGIIEKLLSEARTQHLPVELGVFKSNHSALKLYRRLGFKQISETPTHILMKFA
ncbi:MAG: hypothetical protein A2X30_01390 [Elusimicrobia bacterium GWB2_63_16]|nr:MAG: hypothetical protein A2X30_01390 [Elusimicrobia bacterium GWB2_63_16]